MLFGGLPRDGSGETDLLFDSVMSGKGSRECVAIGSEQAGREIILVVGGRLDVNIHQGRPFYFCRPRAL